MNFFDYIRSWFITATQLFVNLALESYSSWYIPNVMGDIFGALSTFTARVAGYLYDASNWYDDTARKLTTFFTELDLTAWFKPWTDKILDAWNWFRDRWNWFWQSAGEWWGTIIPTVRGWIDIATTGLDSLKVAWNNFWNITFPEWTGKLNNLSASWTNFWAVTLPTLVSFQWLSTWWNSKLKEVDDLMVTKLKDWFPFYKSLADLWNSVAEFITDPLQWLYDRLEVFFDRFW